MNTDVYSYPRTVVDYLTRPMPGRVGLTCSLAPPRPAWPACYLSRPMPGRVDLTCSLASPGLPGLPRQPGGMTRLPIHRSQLTFTFVRSQILHGSFWAYRSQIARKKRLFFNISYFENYIILIHSTWRIHSAGNIYIIYVYIKSRNFRALSLNQKIIHIKFLN